jgi:dUTP pyrophosphatase
MYSSLGSIKPFKQILQNINMVQIQFKKLSNDAVIPHFSRDGDAAFDLSATESVSIPSKERKLISTSLACAFPAGYVLLFRDRSGMAAKSGITGFGGVIDSNYRGELKVILYNSTNEPYEVTKGDRIMQALLMKLPDTEIVEVDSLDDTNRGENAWGSSGK